MKKQDLSEKKSVIYFLNKLIGEHKGYVGSTSNINQRFSGHKSSNRTLIGKEIKKSGFDSFQKIIIEFDIDDKYELRKWEKFYIGLFGTHKDDNEDFGLNVIRDPNKPILLGMNKGIKRPYLSERNKNTKPALGRTGAKHPLSKKIIYTPKNLIFDSIKDCGEYFGISANAIQYRMRCNPEIYKLL
jgi:hypothetical protein